MWDCQWGRGGMDGGQLREEGGGGGEQREEELLDLIERGWRRGWGGSEGSGERGRILGGGRELEVAVIQLHHRRHCRRRWTVTQTRWWL